MTRLEAILDYLKEMRKMGQGVWQSRIFFMSIFLITISISWAIIIIAYNIRIEDVVSLINYIK